MEINIYKISSLCNVNIFPFLYAHLVFIIFLREGFIFRHCLYGYIIYLSKS